MNADIPFDSSAVTGLEIFRGLSSSELHDVIASARIRALPRGSQIFDQGEPTKRAHALLAGAVRISQTGRDGEQVVIRFISAGEIFGSVAIYTDHRYPADAVAMADSVEVSWREDELLAMIERHARVAINMITVIGRRLGELQERVRELATQRVEQRVANTLLRLARQAGTRTQEGLEIDFPLRRKDIADISGTTLHTVSRTLRDWERDGLLANSNQRITLRSTAEIEQIAGT